MVISAPPIPPPSDAPNPAAFPGAHRRVLEAARQGLEVYVLAEVGEWGRFESVVTYDRVPQRVHVRQYVVRAPVDLD